MYRTLRGCVETLWYPSTRQRRHPLWTLSFLFLLPFSWLYALISLLLQYINFGLRYRSPVPVIVVGNLTVGGTGKTPLVAYLAEQLQRQGFKPGIISRGYGRKTSHSVIVTAEQSVAEVGDEAMLLFQLTQKPMVVSNSRNQAIQALLSHFPEVNLIISDDGLQHAALQADVRIVVVDASRQFGNGQCLPAGPLRAPLGLGRFSQADLIVVNESPGKGYAARAKISYTFPRTPIHAMQFQAEGFIHLKPNVAYHALPEPLSVSAFSKRYTGPMHAVAGIGHPRRFFEFLETLGLSILRHPFPDHHNFQVRDLYFNPKSSIIMTEKDAIKCISCLPPDRDCWALRIRATIEESFLDTLKKAIQEPQR
jgi:tetraacyldisaccharide 4'-kinase